MAEEERLVGSKKNPKLSDFNIESVIHKQLSMLTFQVKVIGVVLFPILISTCHHVVVRGRNLPIRKKVFLLFGHGSLSMWQQLHATKLYAFQLVLVIGKKK